MPFSKYFDKQTGLAVPGGLRKLLFGNVRTSIVRLGVVNEQARFIVEVLEVIRKVANMPYSNSAVQTPLHHLALTRADLRPGLRFTPYNRGRKLVRHVVKSVPRLAARGWVMDVEHTYSGVTYAEVVYLADFGIVPYHQASDGRYAWHDANCIFQATWFMRLVAFTLRFRQYPEPLMY